LAQKLYTYALGRPPVNSSTHLDSATLAYLIAGLEARQSFEELLVEIVTSAPFTSRRGEPAGGMP
jgi:hypothetical protein